MKLNKFDRVLFWYRRCVTMCYGFSVSILGIWNQIRWIACGWPANFANIMRFHSRPRYKIPYFKIYIVADQQTCSTVGYEIVHFNTQSLQNLIKLDWIWNHCHIIVVQSSDCCIEYAYWVQVYAGAMCTNCMIYISCPVPCYVVVIFVGKKWYSSNIWIVSWENIENWFNVHTRTEKLPAELWSSSFLCILLKQAFNNSDKINTIQLIKLFICWFFEY